MLVIRMMGRSQSHAQFGPKNLLEDIYVGAVTSMVAICLIVGLIVGLFPLVCLLCLEIRFVLKNMP